MMSPSTIENHPFNLAAYESFISELVSPLGDDVQFFIGGSRRFGYYTKQSDLDIFFYVPKIFIEASSVLNYVENGENSGAKTLLEALTLDGLMSEKRESKYHNKSFGFKTQLFGLGVDLIIFEGELEAFSDLRDEHAKIETFLKENPMVVRAYRDLPVKGAVKYNHLLKLVIEVRKEKNRNS